MTSYSGVFFDQKPEAEHETSKYQIFGIDPSIITDFEKNRPRHESQERIIRNCPHCREKGEMSPSEIFSLFCSAFKMSIRKIRVGSDGRAMNAEIFRARRLDGLQEVFESPGFADCLFKSSCQLEKRLRKRLGTEEAMFDGVTSRLIETARKVGRIIKNSGNYRYWVGCEEESTSGVRASIDLSENEDSGMNFGQFKKEVGNFHLDQFRIETIPEMGSEFEESPKDKKKRPAESVFLRGLRRAELHLKRSSQVWTIFKETLLQYIKNENLDHRFDCREFVKRDLTIGNYYKKEGNFRTFLNFKRKMHESLNESQNKKEEDLAVRPRITQISGLRRPGQAKKEFQSEKSLNLSGLASHSGSNSIKHTIISNLSRCVSGLTGQSSGIQCTSVLTRILDSPDLQHAPVLNFINTSTHNDTPELKFNAKKSILKTESAFDTRINSGFEIVRAMTEAPKTPEVGLRPREESHFSISPSPNLGKSQNDTNSSERMIEESKQSGSKKLKKKIIEQSENGSGGVDRRRRKKKREKAIVIKNKFELGKSRSKNFEKFVITKEFRFKRGGWVGSGQTFLTAELDSGGGMKSKFSKSTKKVGKKRRGLKGDYLNRKGGSKKDLKVPKSDGKRVVSDLSG